MIFKEYLPHPALRDRIECYWKFTVPSPEDRTNVQAIRHVFPPDGCCSSLFINLEVFGHKEVMLVGPTTIIQEVKVFPGSINLGIRLKPGYSQWLYPNLPASLANRSLHVLPENLFWWQQEIIQLIDLNFNHPEELDKRLLIVKQEQPYEGDSRINKAVDLIIQNNGKVSLDEIADHSCLGKRQMQRVFPELTGITIKQFCQIRRLRKAIIDLHIQKKSYAEMVNDRGYADQAHFYKSFRTVGGYQMDRFFEHVSNIDHQLI